MKKLNKKHAGCCFTDFSDKDNHLSTRRKDKIFYLLEDNFYLFLKSSNYLSTSLLVCILMLNTMNLLTMTLQRASLRETLLAEEAFVWAHSCMRPCVPLQIERIIEAFSAECTKVTLHVTVTLHVAIQESLKTEVLATYATSETIGIVLLSKKTFNYNDVLSRILQWHSTMYSILSSS